MNMRLILLCMFALLFRACAAPGTPEPIATEIPTEETASTPEPTLPAIPTEPDPASGNLPLRVGDHGSPFGAI